MEDASAPANTLGLDFEQSKEKTNEDKKPDSKKKKVEQYVNPARAATGGRLPDKLTEEALSERMARIREQNEKIKQRRLDVQADEDAFKQAAAAESVKHAQLQSVQKDINLKREQNAKRKMDKIQSREWDSPKAERRENNAAGDEEPTAAESSPQTVDTGSWRGRGSRGRGRGRGRGPRQTTSTAESKTTESQTEDI